VPSEHGHSNGVADPVGHPVVVGGVKLSSEVGVPGDLPEEASEEADSELEKSKDNSVDDVDIGIIVD
jgi:hypothetical protein